VQVLLDQREAPIKLVETLINSVEAPLNVTPKIVYAGVVDQNPY